MKKKYTKIIIVLSIFFIAIIGITATYAVWLQNAGESKFLEFGIVDENPSIKYQIYVPIDENGDRIDGALDVQNRSYTLSQPSDIDLVSGYALVGWDGGISLTRMELPSEYTMEIDGEDYTYSTLSVIVDEDFTDYGFTDNMLIEEIEIPDSVLSIDSGAFSSMTELSLLSLTGEGDITIGDYAFANCNNLNNIDTGNRTIIGDEHLIFFRS